MLLGIFVFKGYFSFEITHMNKRLGCCIAILLVTLAVCLNFVSATTLTLTEYKNICSINLNSATIPFIYQDSDSSNHENRVAII
jgi:hypothetical protein